MKSPVCVLDQHKAGAVLPRFVILEHNHPELHWDFMLERDGLLKTWRLARPPEANGKPIAATALADHRLAYLEYEGPVSGGRGEVKRWDGGVYEVIQEPSSLGESGAPSPPAREGSTECVAPFTTRLQVRLHGCKLRASAVIESNNICFS